MVYRYYAEKKAGFAAEANALFAEARDFLGLSGLASVRVFSRYDVETDDAALARRAADSILSEPPVDTLYAESLPELAADFLLAAEPLPGQYDQRADSASQCIELLGGERPAVRCAKVYAFYGALSDADKSALRSHLINAVESREAAADKPETLAEPAAAPAKTAVLDGFRDAADAELARYAAEYSLAMDEADLRFMRTYFRDEERRDPTETELRLIDTYWSDHCRHTTFLTSLENIKIADGDIKKAFGLYLSLRREVYGEAADARPVTLMDVATIAAKTLARRGLLPELDVSEEVNACSVHIDVAVDGEVQDWLLMFKNETHNHPTEIEPFGGAATCIGGAIRDPLSGRAYVYQAMRVTGAADPTAPAADTIPGKLPQRRLTAAAARGYSSYGNQIGLATGLVSEFYHPGYAAKRMEIGAVVGAVKYGNVRRETPAPGDVVILLGGRTGRDGIGGATGSSKPHDGKSVVSMASEVQKGNAPEERKIQRLFRDAEVTKMIKRCNDFGAGGVSVAIGELADGLEIDLSKVRKKYDGLSATELAISESQERMAVVVAAGDGAAFIEKAAAENLEAYAVAVVTESPRLVMRYGGAAVADLSREFLSSNGAKKSADAEIFQTPVPLIAELAVSDAQVLRRTASDLRYAPARGLSELFDASVGQSAVLAPYGGATQRTKTQVMASLIPVQNAETTTASVMSFGFDPYLAERSPYLGAKFAVTTSLSKLAAAGADPDRAYLSFQEYFGKPRRDPARWGQPLAALLGALETQIGYGAAAIGGKDSMSGSFGADGAELNVPPTLVSFAIAPADAETLISPELKSAGNALYLAEAAEDCAGTLAVWRRLHGLISAGTVASAYALDAGGLPEALINITRGNEIGVRLSESLAKAYAPGSIVFEAERGLAGFATLGETIAEPAVITADGASVSIAELSEAGGAVLEAVFPTAAEPAAESPVVTFVKRHTIAAAERFARPRAVVFAFPGTNSEYDTARALERAGASAEIRVIRNLTPDALRGSVAEAASAVANSQIVVLPGGFSGGDEPDGSAKFIASFFRAPVLRDAVSEHLNVRDGLMLGICNGFQALIKLGLVPYGWISEPNEHAPTLTFNTVGRHIARYAYTRVASVQSPWASRLNAGEVYAVPLSHGEGRFAAETAALQMILSGGQAATQYCSADGTVGTDTDSNPNGSLAAIEGLYSPDGRVFGKMGHIERRGKLVGRNIHGEKHMPVFESGVAYYN
ncbi:MAG: phosphoribosylformylglycinamidine synthase [Oscillospiraceae bacterium]|jgi:phosphoribosylformylglycinamidine synthase|nr:phosphoribosylformylglycinamidine synthase [Oscillospiraceae bacterium]